MFNTCCVKCSKHTTLKNDTMSFVVAMNMMKARAFFLKGLINRKIEHAYYAANMALENREFYGEILKTQEMFGCILRLKFFTIRSRYEEHEISIKCENGVL